ncbi:MAG TPA: TIGR00304 family protein [Methanobacterium sp.]|nr:TIGR00304 family protein [Methanobacterium sp.]
MNPSTLIIAGIIVIFLGVILIFVGTALQSTSKTSEVHTGGVILIGPIPIIFGNDKSLIVTGVVFAIIIMVLYYFLFYRGSS